MIFDVRVKTNEAELDLFTNAEHTVETISHFDQSTFEMNNTYIHRYIVKSKTKQEVINVLLTLKLKKDATDVVVTKKSRRQLKAEKQRREFFANEEATVEDMVTLSGVTPVIPTEEVTTNIFGHNVSQTDLREILSPARPISTLFDLQDPNIPTEGYMLGFPKLTAVEFEQRINFFRKNECGVCAFGYYRPEQSYVILEQLPMPVQVEYKMRWENPKEVHWFSNNSIDYIKKLAGII